MSENKLSFLKVTKYMYAHVVERERKTQDTCMDNKC